MLVAPRPVGIDRDEIERAIAELEESIARSARLKTLYEELLVVQNDTAAPPKRRGRPKGSKNKTLAKKGPGRRRGPRGKTLRETVVEVLKASDRALRPVQIRDQVLVSGYETSSPPQNLYTSVMTVLAKEPGVSKSPEGYSFDASLAEKSASNGTGPGGKTKRARKSTGRKTPVRRRRKASAK